MDKRELEMYKVQDVIEDLLRNEPVKKIARTRKISKNTVRKYRDELTAILKAAPESEEKIDLIMKKISVRRKEERSQNFLWLDRNRELLEMLSGQCGNYIRLNEVINERGYAGSYSALIRYVAKNQMQGDKAIIRIETKPGEIAQVDFGYCGLIYDEESNQKVKAYVFVMVLGYSRDAYYEIVKNQNVETWCACHVHAFEHFGGVTRVVIPDNLKSAIVKASFTDPCANRSYADLARHYGFQIDPCLPGTPEHKGKVESGVKYVKNNFLPLRTFKDFADANKQLAAWNESTARLRIHGTTRRQPKELFEKHERAALTELTFDRFEIPVWKQLKVYRDIHIQFDNAYYSVPHEMRGETVWARKTASQVAIYRENTVVSVHFPVSKGRRSTKPEHYPPDAFRYMQWDSDYCILKAQEHGIHTEAVVKKLLLDEPIRNLRGAQNIIRMSTKYGSDRLERACERAVLFGNYSYSGIKTILERNLEKETDHITQRTPLDDSFARNIHDLLQEDSAHGMQ